MIGYETSGDFKNTENFLKEMMRLDILNILNRYGEAGVRFLAENTPVDTGSTAESWGYEITETKNGYKVSWTNSNINDGANVAVLIQYGHAQPNGGYVPGIDYINPTMKPLFDKLQNEVWEEVTSA